MGWNDRLFDDPYKPYESQEDRDAYDNWAMYVELSRLEAAAGAGLSSQTISPEQLSVTDKSELKPSDARPDLVAPENVPFEAKK
ncbi:hypothetical protein EBZ39_04745 [bacterium]|nr:hypothetical protein [bacterium]